MNIRYALFSILTIKATFAQVATDDCPKSVMIGNDTYDLAGDIRTYGSAQALLSKINEAIQRDLPAICSGPRSGSGDIEKMIIRNDQRACEKARTRLMTMKAAAEACVASARSQTTAPPLANTWQGSSPSEITAAMMQRHFDQNAHGRDAQAQQRPSAEQLRRNEGNAGYARGSQTPNMSGGDPDGGSGHGTTIPNAPFQKLDPDADHDGKGCAFFTKPAVTNDGGRLNYYGEGAYVVYGKWMYKCEYGRWSNMGPTRLWSKADVERLNAEKQETSTLRSYPFFEKD